MPPHTAEDIFVHHKARQFFYILSGEAEMNFRQQLVQLHTEDGIEADPMEAHQMRAVSDQEDELIVDSMPKAHKDRDLI